MVKRNGYRCAPPILRGYGIDLPDGQISERDDDLTVQPKFQKYFSSRLTQIKSNLSLSRPTEGRIAIVTDAGRDAMDADSVKDESA
jgi:hypothetical protein